MGQGPTNLYLMTIKRLRNTVIAFMAHIFRFLQKNNALNKKFLRPEIVKQNVVLKIQSFHQLLQICSVFTI